MSTAALTHLRAHRFAGLAGGRTGPRLIVTGAVHGNETAGTRGIDRVLGEIERGEIAITRGTVTFVPVCNPLAYTHGRRMGDRNLKRRLQPSATPQDNEDRIANVLCPLLAEHEVLLDLHSFRSPGRPFVMRQIIRSCRPHARGLELVAARQQAHRVLKALQASGTVVIEGPKVAKGQGRYWWVDVEAKSVTSTDGDL
jgi:predicted deacylase